MTGIQVEYARALFQLALENQELETIKDGFQAFVKALDQDARNFFNHPKISRAEKRQVLEKTIALELLRHFLYVLVDNDRMNLADSIYYAFAELINEMNRVQEATVFTRTELTEAQLDEIRSSLSKKFNRKIAIRQQLDGSIISGIRIQIDGTVIDETGNRQIEDLKALLKRG